MHTKPFLSLKNHFVASLLAILIIFVFQLNLHAQTLSPPNALSLTVKLQSAYNPGFKMCTPISLDDQLEFSWSSNRGLVHSSVSVLLAKPEGGGHPIKFVLKEGMLNGMREIKLEPKLELEKPYESSTQNSGGFEISYKQTLLLSAERCK